MCWPTTLLPSTPDSAAGPRQRWALASPSLFLLFCRAFTCICSFLFVLLGILGPLGRLRPLIQSLLVDQSGRRQQGRQSSSCRHFTHTCDSILLLLPCQRYPTSLFPRPVSQARSLGPYRGLGLWTVSCHSFFWARARFVQPHDVWRNPPGKWRQSTFI